MEDVESMLSRARLQLLDKRKEVRKTVHDHYRDLIGVSNHAMNVQKQVDSLQAAYTKMISLSRHLRVKAATGQLAGESSPRLRSTSSMSSTNEEQIMAIERQLSLNGRILFLANKYDFASISHILETELSNSAIPNPNAAFISRMNTQDLKDRILKYCMKALGSSNMDTVEKFTNCISLINKVGDPASLSVSLAGDFWARRCALLDSLKAMGSNVPVSQLIIHYDLSTIVADQCGLPPTKDILDRYGSHQGVIGLALFEALHVGVADLETLSNRYKLISSEVSIFRSSMQIKFPSDDTILVPIMRQVAELVVRSSIANTIDLHINQTGWSIHDANENLYRVIDACNMHFPNDKFSPIIGQELGKQLNAAVVSLQQQERSVLRSAVHLSALLHALSGKELLPSITSYSSKHVSAIVNLDRLGGDSNRLTGFDAIADYVDAKIIEKIRFFVFEEFENFFTSIINDIPSSASSSWGSVRTRQEADVLSVPIRPSPRVEIAVITVSKRILQMPMYTQSNATRSAKVVIRKKFPNHPSSKPTLSDLFDAHYLDIVLSSLEDDNGDSISEVEETVLADPVDRVLYKDLIRRCAMDACIANRRLLGPLLMKNPVFASAVSASGPPVEIIRESELIDVGACERFPTLPISARRRSSTSTTPPVIGPPVRGSSLVGGFNANSVTSFFSSVGKITLGNR